MTALVTWLTSISPIHLIGLIAIVVLVALGTVSVAEGLPLITGLIGLAIPTAGPVTPVVTTTAIKTLGAP